MKALYARSLSLPKGVPVRVFETVDELEQQAGVKGKAIELANSYLVQKGCLVWARDWLKGFIETGVAGSLKAESATETAKTKLVPDLKLSYKVIDKALANAAGLFAPDAKLNKTVEIKDDKGTVTGTKVENTETEGKYIKRFRAAVQGGKVVIDSVKGADPAALTVAELAWEQSLLDSYGQWDVDAKKSELSGKSKAPPQYATNAAKKILANKSGAKWVKTFNDEGIVFQAFDTKDAAANELNLAWAIKAREDKKAETEYV